MSYIVICGSMKVMDEIRELEKILRFQGHEVVIPDQSEKKFDYADLADEEIAFLKNQFLKGYLEKIRQADIVLIANAQKDGISGYVGPNTLIELAFAFALKKQIVLLNEMSDQPCRAEVLGMHPIILKGGPERLSSSL